LTPIRDNFNRVRERIDLALRRSGREGEEVLVVAVTKNVGIEDIEEAVAAGLRTFGENRVQEAGPKVRHFEGRGLDWHMIGHLQRNKVKTALPLFSMIHSLDSMALAREISKRAEGGGREVDLLLQVNTSGEETKYGIAPSKMEDILGQVEELPNIKIRGLMTIGPFTDEEGPVRESFRALYRLFVKAREMRLGNTDMRFLSMGMSGDYEIAVEEGSNMVRLGTALFGPREKGGGPK
jgi:hypothetical protein